MDGYGASHLSIKDIVSKWRGRWNQIENAWQRFWFEPQDLFNVSLFRFVLGLSLLVMYAIRFTEFNYFFTDAGVIPAKDALRILPEGYSSFQPFFISSDSGIRAQGIIHLGLLGLFVLGAFGRSLTWLLFIVNLGLIQRNMSVVYGADLFANFWLFYLSFIDHNRHFSIWNWILPSRRSKGPPMSDWMSTAGIRLIQIQLCISYAYTGVEKLKGLQWWEGSAVWYVIGMEEIVAHDFSFMQNYPIIIGFMSMATVIFEIYFIFAVWNKKLRAPWLLVGFLFHLGTAIFMDLWFFFLVMISAYILFLPPLRGRWAEFFGTMLNKLHLRRTA